MKKILVFLLLLIPLNIKTAEYERGKAEGSKEVENMKFDAALETALKGFKVKDKASIMGHLNMKTIGKEKDEKTGEIKITGLDEQMKAIQEKRIIVFVNNKGRAA